MYLTIFIELLKQKKRVELLYYQMFFSKYNTNKNKKIELYSRKKQIKWKLHDNHIVKGHISKEHIGMQKKTRKYLQLQKLQKIYKNHKNHRKLCCVVSVVF